MEKYIKSILDISEIDPKYIVSIEDLPITDDWVQDNEWDEIYKQDNEWDEIYKHDNKHLR